MARQKQTRKRKQKAFGRLPVSNLAGNASDFINKELPRFRVRIEAARKALHTGGFCAKECDCANAFVPLKSGGE